MKREGIYRFATYLVLGGLLMGFIPTASAQRNPYSPYRGLAGVHQSASSSQNPHSLHPLPP